MTLIHTVIRYSDRQEMLTKTYRFKELANGTLVAHDPAYPIDGPKVIEKARAKVEKPNKEARK